MSRYAPGRRAYERLRGECPPPTPERKREAARKKARNQPAIRRWIDFLEQRIGHRRNWPHRIKLAFFVPLVPNRRERFIVTVFLLANGIYDDEVLTWYNMSTLLSDCEKANIRHIIERFPHERWVSYLPLEQRMGRVDE